MSFFEVNNLNQVNIIKDDAFTLQQLPALVTFTGNPNNDPDTHQFYAVSLRVFKDTKDREIYLNNWGNPDLSYLRDISFSLISPYFILGYRYKSPDPKRIVSPSIDFRSFRDFDFNPVNYNDAKAQVMELANTIYAFNPEAIANTFGLELYSPNGDLIFSVGDGYAKVVDFINFPAIRQYNTYSKQDSQVQTKYYTNYPIGNYALIPFNQSFDIDELAYVEDGEYLGTINRYFEVLPNGFRTGFYVEENQGTVIHTTKGPVGEAGLTKGVILIEISGLDPTIFKSGY